MLAIIVKGGPYIGKRGGRWADPKHTIPWKKPTKDHLFHATPEHKLESIQEHGLKRRAGGGTFNHGTYGAHSQGKVFLAAHYDAANAWHGKVEDQMHDQHDDEAKHKTVTLRVKPRATKRDEVGDDDIEGSRYTESDVPPEDIEYHDEEHGWRPLAKWSEGRATHPDEDQASHPGGEADRIVAQRGADERVAAERRKVGQAARDAHATEAGRKRDMWHARSDSAREQEAARLASIRSPIPGRTMLDLLGNRDMLGVDENGKVAKSVVPGVIIKSERPSGSGWVHVPGGKKGGYRKRKGAGWEYWYPSGGSGARHERHHAEARADAERMALRVSGQLDDTVPADHPARRLLATFQGKAAAHAEAEAAAKEASQREEEGGSNPRHGQSHQGKGTLGVDEGVVWTATADLIGGIAETREGQAQYGSALLEGKTEVFVELVDGRKARLKVTVAPSGSSGFGGHLASYGQSQDTWDFATETVVRGEKKSHPIEIVVKVPPSFHGTPDEFREKVREVLAHEMAHAIDELTASHAKRDKKKYGDYGENYYNDPAEIVAYRHNIFRELNDPKTHAAVKEHQETWGQDAEEARELREFWREEGDETRAMSVHEGPAHVSASVVAQLLHTHSKTWLQIEPHLTPENRRKMLTMASRVLGAHGDGTSHPAKKSQRRGDLEKAMTVTLGPNLTGRMYEGTVNYRGILLGVEHKPGAVNPHSGQATIAGYGEIPGTLNVDGDPVDFLLGPDGESDIVFVIQQRIPNSQADPHVGDIRANGGPQQYDEDKLVFGAWTEGEARELYHDYYDGADREIGGVLTMSTAYAREILFCPARAGLPVMKNLIDHEPKEWGGRAYVAKSMPGIFSQLDAIVASTDGDPEDAIASAMAAWSGAHLLKAKPAGAGWEAIPGGKKGGYRKRKGGGKKGYDYSYAGQHEHSHHPDWEPDAGAGTGVHDLDPGKFVFVLGRGTTLKFRYHPEHEPAAAEGYAWVQSTESGHHEQVRESNIQRARGFDLDERKRKEGGKRKRKRGTTHPRPRPSGGRTTIKPKGKKRVRGPDTFTAGEGDRVPVYEGEDGAAKGTIGWNLENGVYAVQTYRDRTGSKKGAFIPPEHQAQFLAEHAGMANAAAAKVAKRLGVKLRDSQGPTTAYEEVFAGAQVGLVHAVRAYEGNVPFAVQAISYMSTYARESASRELGRGVPLSARRMRMVEGFLAAQARSYSEGGDTDAATIASNWQLTKKHVAPDVEWGRYATQNRKGDTVARDQGAMQVPMGEWAVLDPAGNPTGKSYPGKVKMAEDLLAYTTANRMDASDWLDDDTRLSVLPKHAGYTMPLGTALFYRQEVDDILTELPDDHRAALVLRWGLDGGGEMALSDIAQALDLKPKRDRGAPKDAAALKRQQRNVGTKAVDRATRAFQKKAEELNSPVADMVAGWSNVNERVADPIVALPGPSQADLTERFGGGEDGAERTRIYMAGVHLGVGDEFAKVLEQEGKGGVPEAQSRALREAYHEYRDHQRVKMFHQQTKTTTIDTSAVRTTYTGQNPADDSLHADEVIAGYMRVVAKRGLPGAGTGGAPKRSGADQSKVWSEERLDRFFGRRREPKAKADGQSSEDNDGEASS